MIVMVKIKPPPGQKVSDLFVGGKHVKDGDSAEVPIGVAAGYFGRGWVGATASDHDKIEAYIKKNLAFEASEPSKPALNVETLVPDHDTEPDDLGGSD